MVGANVNHHGKKIRVFLLSNYWNRCLNLFNVLKEKLFSNWYFFQL
jgi:hypothetical protein